jgi:glutaredoxin
MLCALNSVANAQMHKWVDANGKIVYSDTPPPPNAKKLGTKAMDNAPRVSNVRLPLELAAAVAKNPVTLYTAKNCAVCNEARSLLKQNGSPFMEKTIESQNDIDKLKQVSGDTNIPFLLINTTKLSGFQAIDWRTALSSAGYPETNMLPKEYRYPEPEPAAPPVVDASKPVDNTPKEAPRPKSTSPTGIRF